MNRNFLINTDMLRFDGIVPEKPLSDRQTDSVVFKRSF